MCVRALGIGIFKFPHTYYDDDDDACVQVYGLTPEVRPSNTDRGAWKSWLEVTGGKRYYVHIYIYYNVCTE